MGVDSGYGSGKARSAANSSARRRVAAGKMTKSKPKSGVTLNKVAKAAGNVVDFAFNGPKANQGKYLEVGVSPLKLAAVAKALFNAGKTSKAAGVSARVVAKTEGRAIRGQIDDLQNLGEFGPTMKWLRRERLKSERVFPKITKYSDAGMFNRYGDMLPKATRKARGIKRVNPQAE